MTLLLRKKQEPNERIGLILNEIKNGDSILDLGCVDHSHLNENSPDWIHKFLYEKSTDVLGVDFEKEDIEILQKKGYNVIFGNVEEMNLGKKFDVVIAGELIASLSNPGLFLDNVYKHLKDDGKFILTTTNAWVFYRCIMPFFSKNLISGQYVSINDYETITQLLQRHGFEIMKFNYILYPPKRKTDYEWPDREEFKKYREYSVKNKSSLTKTIMAFLFRKVSVFLYKIGLKEVSAEGLFFVCSKHK